MATALNTSLAQLSTTVGKITLANAATYDDRGAAIYIVVRIKFNSGFSTFSLLLNIGLPSQCLAI